MLTEKLTYSYLLTFFRSAFADLCEDFPQALIYISELFFNYTRF